MIGYGVPGEQRWVVAQARLTLHAQEAGRLFGRRRREGGAEAIQDDDAGELAAAAGRIGLERLAQELIIARWFAVRGSRRLTDAA